MAIKFNPVNAGTAGGGVSRDADLIDDIAADEAILERKNWYALNQNERDYYRDRVTRIKEQLRISESR
jgi:hypothetical protein